MDPKHAVKHADQDVYMPAEQLHYGSPRRGPPPSAMMLQSEQLVHGWSDPFASYTSSQTFRSTRQTPDGTVRYAEKKNALQDNSVPFFSGSSPVERQRTLVRKVQTLEKSVQKPALVYSPLVCDECGRECKDKAALKCVIDLAILSSRRHIANT